MSLFAPFKLALLFEHDLQPTTRGQDLAAEGKCHPYGVHVPQQLYLLLAALQRGQMAFRENARFASETVCTTSSRWRAPFDAGAASDRISRLVCSIRGRD